jgi:hypothetical protein
MSKYLLALLPTPTSFQNSVFSAIHGTSKGIPNKMMAGNAHHLTTKNTKKLLL